LYKTKHSLRATAATKLYRTGAEVDEWEKTGHYSLEGFTLKQTMRGAKYSLNQVIISIGCAVENVHAYTFCMDHAIFTGLYEVPNTLLGNPSILTN
jgi:hypothetical protein